jgi:DNA-binding XRE family transcriptional regulator
MKFIKKIREKLGYTKYEMSKKLDYATDKSYHQFENSKRAVNMEKLIKLGIYQV